MGKRATRQTGPGCQHPYLRPFAEAFVSAWQEADPVEGAAHLGVMAQSWTPRKRRRALAARIALLSAYPAPGATAGPEEDMTNAADAAPDGDLVTDGRSDAAAAEDSKRRPPRRNVPPPAMGAASAAGLLADLASLGSAETKEVEQKSDVGRLDLRNTGPVDRIDKLAQLDSLEWSQDGGGSGFAEGGNLLERRMRDDDDTPAPVAKKHTMTDLSLAILTGEFSSPASVTEDSAEPEPAAPSAEELSSDVPQDLVDDPPPAEQKP